MVKGTPNFRSYIRKIVEDIDTDTSVSKAFLDAMDKVANNVFDKLATCASRLAVKNKRMTIKDDDVLMAIKIVFPGYLALGAQKYVKDSLDTFKASE